MTQELPDNWEQIIMDFPEMEITASPESDEMEPAPKFTEDDK